MIFGKILLVAIVTLIRCQDYYPQYDYGTAIEKVKGFTPADDSQSPPLTEDPADSVSYSKATWTRNEYSKHYLAVGYRATCSLNEINLTQNNPTTSGTLAAIFVDRATLIARECTFENMITQGVPLIFIVRDEGQTIFEFCTFTNLQYKDAQQFGIVTITFQRKDNGQSLPPHSGLVQFKECQADDNKVNPKITVTTGDDPRVTNATRVPQDQYAVNEDFPNNVQYIGGVLWIEGAGAYKDVGQGTSSTRQYLQGDIQILDSDFSHNEGVDSGVIFLRVRREKLLVQGCTFTGNNIYEYKPSASVLEQNAAYHPGPMKKGNDIYLQYVKSQSDDEQLEEQSAAVEPETPSEPAEGEEEYEQPPREPYTVNRDFGILILQCFSTQIQTDSTPKVRIGNKVGFSWEDEIAGKLDNLLKDPPIVYEGYVPNTDVVLQRSKRYAYPVGGTDTQKPFRYLYIAFIGLLFDKNQSITPSPNTIHIVEEGKYRTDVTIKIERDWDLEIIGEVKEKIYNTINSSLQKLVQIENNMTDIVIFQVRREGELTLKDLGINKLANPYSNDLQKNFAIEAGAQGSGKLTLTDVYFFANMYNFLLKTDVKKLNVSNCKFEIHRANPSPYDPSSSVGKLKYKQLNLPYQDIDDFRIKSESYDYILQTWGERVGNAQAAAVVIIARPDTKSEISHTTFRNIRRLQQIYFIGEYSQFGTIGGMGNTQGYPSVGEQQDAFKIAAALAIYAPRAIDQISGGSYVSQPDRIGGIVTITNSKFINCRSPLTGAGAVVVNFNLPDNELRDIQTLPSGQIYPLGGYGRVSVTDSIFVECKGRLAGAILLTGEDLPITGADYGCGLFTISGCIFSDNTAVFSLSDFGPDFNYTMDSKSYSQNDQTAVEFYNSNRTIFRPNSGDNVASYYPYSYKFDAGISQSVLIPPSILVRLSQQATVPINNAEDAIQKLFNPISSQINPTTRLYDFGIGQQEYKNRTTKGYRLNLQGSLPYEEEGIQILYGSVMITVLDSTTTDPAIIQPKVTGTNFYDETGTSSSSDLYTPMILFAGASRTLLQKLILRHFDQDRVNVPLLEVSEYAEVQFKDVNFENWKSATGETFPQKTPFIQIFGGIVYIDSSNIQGAQISKETSFIVASKDPRFEKGRFDNKPGWLYHLERNLRSINYLSLIEQYGQESVYNQNDYIDQTSFNDYDDEDGKRYSGDSGDQGDQGDPYGLLVSNKVTNKDQNIVNQDLKFNSDSNDEGDDDYPETGKDEDKEEGNKHTSLMNVDPELVEGTARKEGTAVIIVNSNISNINRELGDEVEVIPPEEGEESKGPTYNVIGRGTIVDSTGVYTLIRDSKLSGVTPSSTSTSNSYLNMKNKNKNKSKTKKNEGFDPLVDTCEWYSAGIATHGKETFLFVKGTSELAHFAEGAIFVGQGSAVVVDNTSKFTLNTNPAEANTARDGVQRNIHCRGSGSEIDAQSISFSDEQFTQPKQYGQYRNSRRYHSNALKQYQHTSPKNESNALWGLIKDESDEEQEIETVTEKGNQNSSLWLLVRDSCKWWGDGWTGKHSDLFFVPSMDRKFQTNRKESKTEIAVTITGNNLYSCGMFGLRVCEFGSQTRCKKETIEKMNVKSWTDTKSLTVAFPYLAKEQKSDVMAVRENIRKAQSSSVGVRLQFGSLHGGSPGVGMGNAVDMHKSTREYFINVPGDVLVTYLVLIILGIVGLIVAGIVCCILTWWCNRRMRNKKRVDPETSSSRAPSDEPFTKPTTGQSHTLDSRQQSRQPTPQIQPQTSSTQPAPMSRSQSRNQLPTQGSGGGFSSQYHSQSPALSQAVTMQPQTANYDQPKSEEVMFGSGGYYNSAQPSYDPAPSSSSSQQVYDSGVMTIDTQQAPSGSGGMAFSSDYE